MAPKKASTAALPGTLTLPPHALRYLIERAVGEDVAEAAGIRYLTPAQRRELVGAQPRSTGEDDSDGLYIPLHGFKKEFIVRALHKDVKQPKFKLKPGSQARPYYPPALDWAKIQKDIDTEISICEGPIKALAMTDADFPAIGINGTHGWMRDKRPIPELDEITWAERSVLLTPDNDVHDKTSVQDGWIRLAQELASRGANVCFRLIPEAEKKYGPDDFLHEFGKRKFGELEVVPYDDPRFADWGIPEVVARLNQRHAIILDGDSLRVYFDRSDEHGHRYALLEKRDFLDYYSDTKKPTLNASGNPVMKSDAEIWFDSRHRRKIQAIVFDPALPWGISPERAVANVWTGYGYEPIKPDANHKCDRYKEHVLKNICSGNMAHFRYVWSWLAYGVQRLNERPGVALVLKGGEGTGKGTFAENYIKLFGEHGLHIHNPQYLVGNFNQHLQNKIAVFADEAIFAGDARVVTRLRGLITDSTNMIEAKFRNASRVDNYMRLIIASNEQQVIHAADDARRFAVFRVGDAHKQDSAYFNAIRLQLEQGGYNALLYELLHWDLSTFDVRAFPQTEELFVQKELSLGPYGEWWMETLLRGSQTPAVNGKILQDARWETFVQVETLLASLPEYVRRDKYEMRGSGRRLSEMFKRYAPGIVWPWRERDVAGQLKRGYRFKSLAECRESFVKTTGIPLDLAGDA